MMIPHNGMMKTPVQYYQQQLNTGHIQPDAHQRPIIEKLNTIFQQLEQRKNTQRRLLGKFKSKKTIKGLYLWGKVGSGKTFLMDCFYHCVTLPKMRCHFHQFMRQIHQTLKTIQGKKDPLQHVAKQFSQKAMIICLDEFFVSSIADAMLLSELLYHLFHHGMTLITSANTPPDLLYKDGLQRERFLPAIALIKQYTDVTYLYTEKDYRRHHIRESGVFYTPLDQTAARNLDNAFTHFSENATSTYGPITVCHRPITIIKAAGNVVWFDFEKICGRPRSQNDYLDIAKRYHTVLIEKLRHIRPEEPDLSISFIYLVDILYDAHCRLVISSDVPMREIITAGKHKTLFERTLSRLIEMQSEEYVYPGSIGPELTLL